MNSLFVEVLARSCLPTANLSTIPHCRVSRQREVTNPQYLSEISSIEKKFVFIFLKSTICNIQNKNPTTKTKFPRETNLLARRPQIVRLDMPSKVYSHWPIRHNKPRPFMELMGVLAEKSQFSDTKLHFSDYVSESYLPLCVQNAVVFLNHF